MPATQLPEVRKFPHIPMMPGRVPGGLEIGEHDHEPEVEKPRGPSPEKAPGAPGRVEKGKFDPDLGRKSRTEIIDELEKTIKKRKKTPGRKRDIDPKKETDRSIH